MQKSRGMKKITLTKTQKTNRLCIKYVINKKRILKVTRVTVTGSPPSPSRMTPDCSHECFLAERTGQQNSLTPPLLTRSLCKTRQKTKQNVTGKIYLYSCIVEKQENHPTPFRTQDTLPSPTNGLTSRAVLKFDRKS